MNLEVQDVNLSDGHYLKQELFQLLANDAKVFEFLLQGALDGIWFWDLENPDQEWMDSKFWQTLGYSPEEKSHSPEAWQALIHPEDLKQVLINFERHCENPSIPYDQIVRYRHKDGGTVWIRCRGLAIRNDDGKLTRMLGVHTDVTALKEAESRLVAQNRSLTDLSELALEAAPNAMLMVDESGEILLCNRAAESLFGYSRSELTHQPVDILVPDEIKTQHPQLLSSFFKAPAARAMGSGRDLVGQHKNKSMIPVEIGLNPITNLGRQMVIASIVDISERKRLERRFKIAIESAPNAMLMINKAGKILLLNKATELLFGYKSHELVNSDIGLLLPNDVGLKHPEFLRSYQRKSNNKVMEQARETTGRCQNGKELPLEIALNPIEEDGESLAIVALVDISKRREQEQKIAKYTLELERSNKELDSFAYVASHDIKAPLRGVMKLAGWLHQDLEAKLDRQGHQYFELIFNRINRLEKLLSDLLTYSRLARPENESLKLVDVKALCLECFALAEPPEGFELQCEQNLPKFLTLVTPFELVLRNLIGNAVKHRSSDAGCIRVSAKESGALYAFSVCDDGCAISEQYHQTIFDIFKTLKPRDEIEGSGIGLSMVRKVLQQYHCTITLESGEKKGNCFTFTWPAEGRFMELLQ